MKKKLTPRYIIIALVLAWAIYAILPSVQYQNLTADEKLAMQEDGTLIELEQKIIKQGLDLKGGIYIVLEVDLPTLVNNLAINKDKRFENVLANVRYQMQDDSELDFFLLFQNEIKEADIRLHRYYDVDFGGNLDEIMASLQEQANDAINRVLEILQNRVDQFGVSEPTIQKQGKHVLPI